MLIELRIATLVIVSCIFILLISLLRKQKLELKYCLVWIFALLGIAVFSIFPSLLDRVSVILGIDVPVNAFFLICIAFLACICVSLTIVVSTLSYNLRKLTQNIAIMENERKSTAPEGNSDNKESISQ